jgi:hypothetical protein
VEAIEEDIGYSPENPDTASGEYVSAGLRHVLQAPGAWLGRVLTDTARAYLQPYGTILLIAPGTPSVRESLVDLFSGEVSAGAFVRTPGLWRRLAMYGWHIWDVLGGLAGFALSVFAGRWRRDFALAAWIVYNTGVTAALLIEPRYLFPAMFAFSVLAAYASVRLWDGLRARLGRPVGAAQSNAPAPEST